MTRPGAVYLRSLQSRLTVGDREESEHESEEVLHDEAAFSSQSCEEPN